MQNVNYEFKDFNNISSDLNFDKECATVIFFHGYMGSPLGDGLKGLAAVYLNRNDHNVIFYDWSKIVADDYGTAVANMVSV